MDFDLNSPNLDGDYKAFKKIEVRKWRKCALVFAAAFSVIVVSLATNCVADDSRKFVLAG